MSYSAEMIPMILKSYGLSIEYAETQINDFMEIDIYKIINPRAMTRTLLREMSDALAENAIATFRDGILYIEKSYETPPNPFSAYSKAISQSKATLPVFFGESMNGYEIVDMKSDGNILICGNSAKARSNILSVALSSLKLSRKPPKIIEIDSADDFMQKAKMTRNDDTETIIIIKDLPALLTSGIGMKVEKMLYTTRNAENIHYIAVSGIASADIITDTIKKALPVRITAKLSSTLNSRIVIDMQGAEMLNGTYDYLMECKSKVIHIHGAKPDTLRKPHSR